jgi:Transglycosylase-like domain
VCARAGKDVIMRPKTTTALALTGTLLAVPAALAAESDDPPSPTQVALRAPVGGHLTVASQMRAEARENRQQDLIRRALKLARRVADARGERFAATAERERLRDQAPDELNERRRELRRDLRAAQAPAASPVLEAIAACESGGDPTTDTGNGFYGKYQFTLETWQAVGGTGNPAQASEAEQDRRAAILYAQAGASPWPVCGR